MYPSLPQNPSPMMQGGNPSQQFGYPPSQMNQGIGGLVPQSPVYGSQPVYMAEGGPVPAGMSGKGQQPQPGQGSGKGQQAPMQQGQGAKGQMASQNGMPQQAPMQIPGMQTQQTRQVPMGSGYKNATEQQRIAGFFSNAGQQAPMQMPGGQPNPMQMLTMQQQGFERSMSDPNLSNQQKAQLQRDFNDVMPSYQAEAEAFTQQQRGMQQGPVPTQTPPGMNAQMMDYYRQQAGFQGPTGGGMGPMQGGGGFPAIARNEAEARMMEQQAMQQGRSGKGQQGPGMGPKPIDYAPGQMPRQSPQDMLAEFSRFNRGRSETAKSFGEAMKNPNLTPAQKQRMNSEFARNSLESKREAQAMQQRMHQARQGGQPQMPQQQLDQLRLAEQIAKMRGMPGPTQADRMNAPQAQQALPAGIQALANFRPQY